MEAEKATAADFPQMVEVIELPEPQGGRRVCVTIRAVDAELLVADLKGVPPLAAPGDLPAETTEESSRLGLALMRTLAEHGIADPEFCFGAVAEPGKAWWGAVTIGNRTAIMDGLMRVSGLGAASPLGVFPGEPGGEGVGASAARTGEAPEESVAGSPAA